MKKISVLFIAIFALAASGFTFLQVNNNAPDDFGPRAKLIEYLKLTEDQQSKFDDLHYKHQKQMIDTRAEIQKNRLEVKKMMDDNKINESKLLELTEANNNLRSQMRKSRVNLWLDVYKMLSNEQKAVWTEHFAGFGERMGRRFGRHGENFRGPCMGQGFRSLKGDRTPPRDGRGRF